LSNGQLPELPPGALFAVRETIDDIHHGLAERKAIRHTDALKHLLDRAEEAGVPKEQREQMASDGFQRIFETLVRPERRGWRSWLRRATPPDEQHTLPGAEDIRRLPPGR
jgi:hypothetical protein